MQTARIVRQIMVGLAVVAAGMAPVQSAPAYTNSNFAGVPVNLANRATPLVMLNMSRDHQLSYKAYTDYADLDGNGAPETTYTDTIDYYGYFDSRKCYTYETGNNRFVPAALAGGTNNHSCSGQWSGNFLNWATMTRMDVVRKLLYGGKRFVDTAELTVLERQYLPTDAHAFAKYYNGETAPIGEMTPFAGVGTLPPEASGTSVNSNNANPAAIAIPLNSALTQRFATTSAELRPQVGDQIKVFKDSGSEQTDWMIGTVTDVSTSGTATTVVITFPAGSSARSGSATNTAWTLRNLSRTGISLCNLTQGPAVSHANANPPMVRVADGNYALWSANERWQCSWSDGEGGKSGKDGYRNGNEAYLSGLHASADNPPTARKKGEYVVRVEVARPGLLGQEKVKQYGTAANPIHKPIGLLQVYADQLHFGLMTGSYSKNVSGGVLRKNIGSFTDEVDPATGIFLPGANGIVANLDRLRMYGYDYGEGSYIPQDNCTYQQIGFVHSGGALAQGSPATEGNCSSWGNPMSEIYLESLRYLAGKTAHTGYIYPNAGSKDSALGLTQAGWRDPLSAGNSCAPINILNFNASVSGYDNDQIEGSPGWADICPAKTARALTDSVGELEHLSDAGAAWFIGNNGSAVASENNQLCSAKPAGAGLGSFTGLCPEAPTQKGTYLMAGMAHYANTNRIRADLEIPPARARSRDLMAATYGIALATNVPKIEVRVASGKKVAILPAYRLDWGNGRFGGGALVDFKVVEQKTDASGNSHGKYYVNWEDSEMGGDYDMDMWGIIEYATSGETITVTTRAIFRATNQPQGFGYVISGTDRDGAHFHSGIEGFNFTYTHPNGTATDRECASCAVGAGATSRVYTATGAPAGLLADPLWYAAKWGGPFANGSPVMQEDGTPANYFHAINPLQLETALNRVLLDIVKRASSGTGAAMVANAANGVGALYQAYYEPLRQDASGREASWSGTVQALWVDSHGYLREDGDGDGLLGGYLTDQVVEFFTDDSSNQTRIRRYTSIRDDTFAPHSMQGTVSAYAYDAASGSGTVSLAVTEVNGASGTWFNNWTLTNLRNNKGGDSSTANALDSAPKTFTVSPAAPDLFAVGDPVRAAHYAFTTDSIEHVRPLWNARKQLSRLRQSDGPDDQISRQRPFAAPADTGRFIKTWIDADGDSLVGPGEFIGFDRNGMAGSCAYLNAASAEAAKVVDYIRGREIEGYRNRTVDHDGTGTAEAMRLGDVINSTPTVVGPPQAGYDLTYRDRSYAAFRKQYANRRQMVYVGANDGMLHAFNGGFYSAANKSFAVAGTGHDGVAATAHPLGSEIWAYVPMNLLPHLKWLTQSGYQNRHVSYVDGKPKVFDAKIFANDADHPEGWGTVLVVGMRFGGGPMTVEIAGGGNPPVAREFRSAYVIMDITNPEAEPRLLAELQVPDASFSSSYPAVLAIRDQHVNKWFLVFGSGPTPVPLGAAGIDHVLTGNVLSTVGSNSNASLFILDLDEVIAPGSSAGGAPPGCVRTPVGGAPSGAGRAMHILACDTGAANSLAGDPTTVDWNLDYKVDSIYFGTAGAAKARSGRLMRLDTNGASDPANWSGLATVIRTDQPVLVAPTVTQDTNRPKNKWIFFGTGRLFEQADLESTDTQSIYGVIDTGVEATRAELRDATNAQTATNGSISGLAGIATFDRLRADTGRGWYLDLPPIQGTAGVSPATRVVSPSILAGGLLFTTAYQPSLDQCAGQGSSRLYGLYYTTGTAHPKYGLRTVVKYGEEVAVPFRELGSGLASGLSVQTSGDLGGNTVAGKWHINAGIDGEAFHTPDSVRSGMEAWRER